MPNWFQEGARCIIVKNTSNHGFKNLTEVILYELHPNCKEYRRAVSGTNEKWWVKPEDCIPSQYNLEAMVKELLG